MESSVLALSLFFHISATVVWIGGLLVTMLLVLPEARRIWDAQPTLYQFMSRLRRRFYPISNLCLAVLIVTGLSQMTADVYYEGFMTFDNTWSQVMLAKHILIVLMAGAGLLLQFTVVPALERASLLVERCKGDPVQFAALRRREALFTWAMIALGVAVLACSAWAGAL